MPEKRLATLDTSFWIHVGMVHALPELAMDFQLTVPSSVADELGVYRSPLRSISGQAMKVALETGMVEVLDADGPLIPEFHAGEKAVLTLALERQDAIVPLLDEVKAYQWAVKKELPVLSVPLWLATRAIGQPARIAENLAKIKALAERGHISMLLAHEPLLLLGASLRSSTGGV